LPIQCKENYDGGIKTRKILQSAYENKKDEEAVILLVEGNHCSGGSANFCKDEILRHMPSAKIIYASVGRDYTHRNSVAGTIFDTFAFYSQEGQKVSKKLIEKYDIAEKITIYPWEILEHELEACIACYATKEK